MSFNTSTGVKDEAPKGGPSLEGRFKSQPIFVILQLSFIPQLCCRNHFKTGGIIMKNEGKFRLKQIDFFGILSIHTTMIEDVDEEVQHQYDIIERDTPAYLDLLVESSTPRVC